MRKYELYLIEESIAVHYNGKERMFYNLFFEHTNAKDKKLKKILQKQIDFITLPIPVLKLQQLLFSELQTKRFFQQKNDALYIENGNLSNAALSINSRCLIIEAEGYYDAESVFFEIIRKNEPSFLAIDMENARYGWLKPIKERNFV
ncbi:sporulation inhibitor of replication protein SirA [Niallia sp. 01092]|uniref:sporulation inhibitor of replication protein SirA n=1 Tax=unclassified Niallia TaxID=2837522 RepID=UPI003FD5DBA3